MPVIGSYKDNIAFSGPRMRAMSRETVEESLDKLHEMVIDRTPLKSGALRDSVKKSAVRRVSRHSWTGKVYSKLEYAAAIEYGMSPQVITPKRREALKFFWGKTGQTEFFSSVNWPGYDGRHMFLKAGTAFDRHHAEDIARNNAIQWLGAIDAGRRTISI